MADLDTATTTELEAAAFRRLVAHLRERTDVQNIDLMALAGFCRNCLSNWLEDAARERNVSLSRPEARERDYGMPQEEWKRLYQHEATPAQTRAFGHAVHNHAAGDQTSDVKPTDPAARRATA